MKLMSEETKRFFLSLLKESESCSLSFMRFASLFTILSSNIVVWYTWIIICTLSKSLVDIPDGVVYVYGIANGVAISGKVAQKFAEEPIKKE